MTAAELDQYIREHLKDDRGWNWKQWDDSCRYRGVHVKHDHQLLDLDKMYGVKIAKLMQIFRDHEQEVSLLPKKQITNLEDKIIRIAAKYRNVLAEIEGRSKEFFKRKPIGTEYFIDFNAGNDGNTGLNIGQAWLTLQQYTTTTVRTAGDIAWLRANTTQVQGAADIPFDEDGDEDDYIAIIGCSTFSGHDPWSDASDVMPVIDFNGNANNLSPSGDEFWYIENLSIAGSIDQYGGFYMTGYSSYWLLVESKCNGNRAGFTIAGGHGRFIDCESSDNTDNGFMTRAGGYMYCLRCVAEGGAGANQDTGFAAAQYGMMVCVDCSSGVNQAHGAYDYRTDQRAFLWTRNCIYGARGISVNTVTQSNAGSKMLVEDEDGVYGSHRTLTYSGNITKVSGAIRSGGSDSHAKLEPSSSCGVNAPLEMASHPFYVTPSFRIWLQGGVSKTITFYCDTKLAWASYPTVDEFYVEAEYLSGSVGTGERTIIRSTEVFTDADLTTFSVTFTPTQEGFVYLNIFLKVFEANRYVRVDIRPDF